MDVGRELLDTLPLLHFVPPATRRLVLDRCVLNNFFRLSSPFARLPARAQQTLLAEPKPITVAVGQVVIQQGDEPGPMYIIEEGRLRVFVDEDGRRR